MPSTSNSCRRWIRTWRISNSTPSEITPRYPKSDPPARGPLFACSRVPAPHSRLVETSADAHFGRDGDRALAPGNKMRLVRNPSYWRSDRPLVDRITIKTLPGEAATVALGAGPARIVWSAASYVQRLKANPATTPAVLWG